MALTFVANLGEEQNQQLKELAARCGQSKSDVLRQVISQGEKQLRALQKRGVSGDVELAVIVRPKRK